MVPLVESVYAAPRLVLHFRGSRFVLQEGMVPLRLGRDADCDLVVETIWVSRHHADLECRDGHVVLTDHSTNGLWLRLDGEAERCVRGESVLLHGGGSFSLGRPALLCPDDVLRFRCS